MFNG